MTSLFHENKFVIHCSVISMPLFLPGSEWNASETDATVY